MCVCMDVHVMLKEKNRIQIYVAFDYHLLVINDEEIDSFSFHIEILHAKFLYTYTCIHTYKHIPYTLRLLHKVFNKSFCKFVMLK